MKKSLIRAGVVAVALFFAACSGGDDSVVNETPNPTPVNPQLGGQGPGGGIIVYLDASNEHGLEVSEVIGTVRWWNVNQNPYNIPSLEDGIGTGMANTEKIVAHLGNNGTYAAKLCKDFVQGGKDDWYLPSKAELEKIYLYGRYNTDCGGCFSIFETLWSSSPKYVINFEGEQIISGIWSTDFAISATWPEVVILPLTPYAEGGLHVRAVRAF
ncbi:MAG: hypothetical protein EOO45_02735 [Flavobacterium sp.]|nr:MAG: hypothetical protein EOO45_02735 [Flavobacterium sp.]